VALPAEMPEEVLAEPRKLIDVLRDLKMVTSGSEAKSLIQNAGIRMNSEVVTDPSLTLTPDNLPVVLQVGKRKFVRLVRQ